MIGVGEVQLSPAGDELSGRRPLFSGLEQGVVSPHAVAERQPQRARQPLAYLSLLFITFAVLRNWRICSCESVDEFWARATSDSISVMSMARASKHLLGVRLRTLILGMGIRKEKRLFMGGMNLRSVSMDLHIFYKSRGYLKYKALIYSTSRKKREKYLDSSRLFQDKLKLSCGIADI